MKFAEHLSAHITPEWRKQYIIYEEMKAKLYAAVEQAPSAELVDPEILTRYFAKFDEQFFSFCDKELAKINTFYSEKLAEATRKYGNLRSELTETLEQGIMNQKTSASSQWRQKNPLYKKKNVPARKLQDLKLAFSEFYLGLILLQNYQNLNFTGFRKILKKHDKLLNVDSGAKWRKNHVELAHFHTNKDIDRIIQETEQAFTQDIEGGDRQRAMKRLRVPPLGEQQSPWTTFKVGLFSGAFVVLLIAVIISSIFHTNTSQNQNDNGDGVSSNSNSNNNNYENINWQSGVRFFRGPLLIIEFVFLWGINVYGWRSSGVNHVLIFELDPRNHLSEQNIMELAAIFGVIWTICVLCFIYHIDLGIPQYSGPIFLYIIMLVFLLNPTKTFRHEARYWTIRVLSRIVLAPFCHVTFADFWTADQLNSIVPAFLDIQYFICFLSSGNNPENQCLSNTSIVPAIVAMLPAWFRCAQCLRRYRDSHEAFPHLVNAVKYSTSFFVVIFSYLYRIYVDSYQTTTDNPWFYCWIAASIVSSCYAYTWDIKMDWGLFDKGENKFLREEIVYSSTWFYYAAIVEDLILRFGWTISMSLIQIGYIEGDVMVSILSPLEVFRRFIWNFFRLENEHLNNCGNFRAVRDISVAPMDSSDQTTILRMMDEENGVINRRNIKMKQQQLLTLSNNNRNNKNRNEENRSLLNDSESIEELNIIQMKTGKNTNTTTTTTTTTTATTTNPIQQYFNKKHQHYQ